MNRTLKKFKKGFTLIEIMVSVSIFAFMTALLVAKYGNFNQSVLLTNLAYDIGLTIRTAQTYGLSVRRLESGAAPFQYAYGVHISNNSNEKQQMIFFADISPDNVYTVSDFVVSTYAIKRGAVISGVCVVKGSSCVAGNGTLDITFKRPDPEALIYFTSSNGVPDINNPYTYAKITVQGVDGGIREVVVNSIGQVSVVGQ